MRRWVGVLGRFWFVTWIAASIAAFPLTCSGPGGGEHPMFGWVLAYMFAPLGEP